MVWQAELEELKHRQDLAEQMGGKESIEKQHSQGKLTARERIALLADPDSFRETGKLAGSGTYDDDGNLTGFTHGNEVSGLCAINGRKVCLNAVDLTVGNLSGPVAWGGSGAGYTLTQAHTLRLPYIRLSDTAEGGPQTLEQKAPTYIPGQGASAMSGLLQVSPVVVAMMTPVAGARAMEGCSAHFSVMVKGASEAYPGGSPADKTSQGDDTAAGDWRTHACEVGVIDNVAETEEDALTIVKRFLSYLPDNVWELPPRAECSDDPNRRDEELMSIIPRESSGLYDPYDILSRVFDRDSFFEISPLYGQSHIIGLAHINGYPVGTMISNCRHLGGAMDVAAGLKVMRFIQLCDIFHLPMVHFADELGFMVTDESQRQGILRTSARVGQVTSTAGMPWMTFVIRQMAGIGSRPGGAKRLAWPSLQRSGAPLRMAEAANTEEITDPRDTRPLLCEFVEMVQPTLASQLGRVSSPRYQP